ncbi:MAG: 3'-5' exonuclease [Butyrivibrio sp.]|nr:3'-5' exonuclease [Butyrivibrio sp.]
MSYREVREFLSLAKGKEFVMFDTETTGLSPESCDVIEFSAIKVKAKEDETFTKVAEIDIFINPGYKLPEEIVSITGITDELLAKEGMSKEAALSKIKAFWGDCPIITGYNVRFDIRFIESLYSKCGDRFTYEGFIDVMKLAKEKLPKPYKLVNVCEALSLTGYSFHRSIDDARATLDVLLKLLPMYESAPDDKLIVTGCTRWTKHGFDRIYINNKQNVSAYYDVNTKEWCINGDYEKDEVVAAVLECTGSEDETALVSAVV